jgi:FMN phosphatase YigB (HAD superfamily)
MAIIIFDLDDTLYDTTRFRKDIEQVFASHEFPEADIRESYRSVVSTRGYTFEEHIRELAKKHSNLDPILFLPNLLALFEKTYIFPGVLETLEQLKNSYTLVLVTLGEEKIQRLKIENAGIEKYFNSIHSIEKDKEKLLRDLNFQGEIYFVNNNLVENEKVRKHFPHFVVIDAKSGEPVVIPSSPLDR